MNKRNLKLIMELIFIFILPLIFICFTSEIQVEREFTYDNQGNYETSQDTKKLSFDNSIIKYNKDVIKNIDISQLLKINQINENRFEILLQLNLLPSTFYIDSNYNYNDPIIEIQCWSALTSTINYSIYLDDDLYLKYTQLSNPNLNFERVIASYQGDTDNLSEFSNTNYQYINYVSQIQDTYYEEDKIYYEENINTIWGNIKQLLIDNLDLNDNVLLDIVLCYTILWVVMWIIWHLFYGFLELLIHIVPRKWEADY